MGPTDEPRPRNVAGLRRRAAERAADTRRRAEDAIALLLREGRPVTFTAVAAAGRVSTAWLYGQVDLKERIAHLRAQHQLRPAVALPPQERASDASKDALIATLRQVNTRLREENAALRRQLEVAYGQLAARP